MKNAKEKKKTETKQNVPEKKSAAKSRRTGTVLKGIFKWTGLILFSLAYTLWLLWCFGAVCYAPMPLLFRGPAAVLFLLLTLSAPLIHPRKWFIAGALLFMLIVTGLWSLISPSHDRMWAQEVAVLPEIRWSSVRPDEFTVTGIRDFRYRAEKDFEVRYQTRTYRLADMTALEYAVVYWNNPLHHGIAHSMLSFRFRSGDALVVSCEARRAPGETYSPLRDLYKKSCLIYVVGTESDLFGVRTNYRNPREQVYLYATNASKEQRELIFRDLAERVNTLRREPQFYNTLTANCITSLIPSIRAGVEIPAFRSAYLLNGFSDYLAFRLGFLDREEGETYRELRARSLLNDRTLNWNGDPAAYSKIIRSNAGKAR